jgi:hypothetical protein
MASWNHDGTQDPGPPPMMPDALSGLVTGGKSDPESVRVRVVEPSMPDITRVREAMASVLDEDSELKMSLGGPPPGEAPAPPPVAVTPDLGANDPDAGDGGEGVGPAATTPTPPVGIQLPPAIVETPRRGRRLRIPVQRDRRGRAIRRRGAWSPGLAAVGLLLLVVGILVIVMLASLIDTISSIFT